MLIILLFLAKMSCKQLYILVFFALFCMLDKNAGKIKVQKNKNSIAHLKVLVL